MQVQVQYFGVLKGIVGHREEAIAVEGSDVQALLDAVVATRPELATALRGVAVAVNDVLVGKSATVPAGATVALLPPVSGG